MATESYNSILDRMSGLNSLATHIEEITKGKTDQTEGMLKLIASMSAKINDVRENVNKIRSGSVAINNRIKEIIKSSDDTQKANLQKIKDSITRLGNVADLNASITGLDKDVSLLVEKAMDAGDDAGADEEGSMFKDAVGPNGEPLKGGYTYGKSRHRGKDRRRRTKKSRRKGNYKR
jgi:methyl-accepting chemotaxis protein